MKKLVLLLTAIFMFSCNKQADFTQIKKGMTLQQVVDLVGEPKEKQEIPFMNAKFYKYEKDVVVFVNDSVTRCEKTADFAKGLNEAKGNMQQSIDSIDAAIEQIK